jgi:hypothetical protein
LETITLIANPGAEGLGVRAIARTVKLSPRTVNRIIVKVGERHERFLKEALKGAPLIEVQLDEIWTFTQKKKASDNPEDIEAGLGETWAWTAIETATRLMLPRWIGGRGLSDAREMLKGLVTLDPGR